MDEDDIKSLALCGWKEARGEGLLGVRAVMHVIWNRVGAPGFAKTLHDVIYGKNQFTSMSVPTDPQFNLQPPPGDAIYAECEKLAAVIETDFDCTDGAHYYANLRTATSGWFFDHIVNDHVGHPVTATIGRHTFFE